MLAHQVRKRQRQVLEQSAAAHGASAAAPPRKLARRSALATRRPASGALRVRESALFRPVRAIGLVTDELPIAPATLGDADFAVASIGRGFQVFDCKRLRLAHIGPRLNEKIRALLSVGGVVLTSLKADIVAWHKLIELGRFRGHTAPATVLGTVGAGFLVSASEAEVLVWQLSDVGLAPKEKAGKCSECIVTPLGKLAVAPGFGSCTAVCHPPTYLHKVLLGSSSGQLSLWNVRTLDRIHTFSAHLAGRKESCAITCIGEVPNVLDLIALGFADGRICILHAREDRVVMEFQQAQGRVTALAFRTGAGAPAHLVTGAPNGSFVVWDLDKRRAHHVAEGSHHGPLSSVHFLPGQPLLLTSGRDNSIRMWIFDTPDGLPRLLRSRCGCPGPARRMAFYGRDNEKELIVGGGNDGAGFVSKISFIQDHQNADYSQAALKKLPASLKSMQPAHINRLPPVVDVAFCDVRHFDWPAVVTAHEQLDAAFVWSAEHQALAPKAMRPEDPKDCAPVTAVAISSDGNYCVLGLENGALHRFNLQSQLHRGAIPKLPAPPPGTPAKAAPAAPRAHRGRICGVEISVSGLVVSLASHPRDCELRTWKLMTHEAAFSVPLPSAGSGCPSGILLRAQGALIAAGLDDGALQVVDLSSASVVRSFACGVPATDVAFSGDARWLAAALRDGGLRIFDLLASRCVDSFVFARPALSLCFAPSSAFLLTSHAKGNAIQVWANKFLFDPDLSAPLLRPEPKEPVRVDEPGAPEAEGPAKAAEDEENEEGDAGKGTSEGKDLPASTAPLEPELLTLSDVPPAKWQATLHLDTVKERNKPAEAPKPLASAPFFLPTAHEGVTPRFAAPLDAEDEEGDGGAGNGASHILQGDRSTSKVAKFQRLLSKGKFDEALKFLREQTPSGVHLAIEELGPMAGGTLEELGTCLAFFEWHLDKAHLADELQAYLSLFLQAHGEELAGAPDLRARCAKLCQALEGRWSALNRQCQKVRCFLGMLTHTQSQW
mmetsp:Transcript_21979/g.58716  ORF Transcript_21979/g.58716 Transcript_21979/m.58716 type:complete len:1003 (-) Transcript_21979:63-3071(-)